MTTPNFGWPLPADTDAVRDGAAAIRALGDAVDGTVDGIDGRVTTVETSGFRFAGVRRYDGVGTFVKADPFGDGNPSGLVVRAVRVKVWGGGGGGGGTEATAGPENVESGSGGGGGYAERFILASDLATSETVTVGSGGAGGAAGVNDGSDGTFSSFGSFAQGNPGAGGRAGEATSGGRLATGGLGGSGTSPDFAVDGTTGSVGRVLVGNRTNQGSGGGAFGTPRQVMPRNNSVSGLVPGGGGTGANEFGNRSARSGGNGGAGRVFVEVFV